MTARVSTQRAEGGWPFRARLDARAGGTPRRHFEVRSAFGKGAVVRASLPLTQLEYNHGLTESVSWWRTIIRCFAKVWFIRLQRSRISMSLVKPPVARTLCAWHAIWFRTL